PTILNASCAAATRRMSSLEVRGWASSHNTTPSTVRVGTPESEFTRTNSDPTLNHRATSSAAMIVVAVDATTRRIFATARDTPADQVWRWLVVADSIPATEPTGRTDGSVVSGRTQRSP